MAHFPAQDVDCIILSSDDEEEEPRRARKMGRRMSPKQRPRPRSSAPAPALENKFKSAFAQQDSFIWTVEPPPGLLATCSMIIAESSASALVSSSSSSCPSRRQQLSLPEKMNLYMGHGTLSPNAGRFKVTHRRKQTIMKRYVGGRMPTVQSRELVVKRNNVASSGTGAAPPVSKAEPKPAPMDDVDDDIMILTDTDAETEVEDDDGEKGEWRDVYDEEDDDDDIMILTDADVETELDDESDASSEIEMALVTPSPIPTFPKNNFQPRPRHMSLEMLEAFKFRKWGADRVFAKLVDSMRTMPKPGDDDDAVKLELPPGLVPLYNHQEYALRWMLWRESQSPQGGILADEMGLGKTISIIALVMKSKMDGDPVVGKTETGVVGSTSKRPMSGATLIVCPMGCLRQWAEEIATKGKGLNVTKYHGSQRPTSAVVLGKSDIVLTTYGTIRKDGKMANSPLKRVHWKRICLDESHIIRNPKTIAAVTIYNLDARYRWAVTGTPVHNRPSDFFSLVFFLRMAPFADQKLGVTLWKLYIGLRELNESGRAGERLQTIAAVLILRRTKEEVIQAGGNIRSIPPKFVEVIEVQLSEAENKLYQTLMSFSKDMFKLYLSNKSRKATEKEEARLDYSHTTCSAPARPFVAPPHFERNPFAGEGDGEFGFIWMLVLFTRLRQCAVHPSLLKVMLEDKDEAKAKASAAFNENLLEHIVSKLNPVIDDNFESAKFKKILEDLEELRKQAKMEERRMDKVVIVSSWSSLLKILNEHLEKRNFSTAFLTGEQNAQARSDAQQAFNGDEGEPQILLLSLMAGGVGLNLVGGNRVFFVEPHWNPQNELQAQDRVHRFGQTKDVFIRRYITADSIENRIMILQEKKMLLADGVLNCRKAGAGDGITLQQMKDFFDIGDDEF